MALAAADPAEGGAERPWLSSERAGERLTLVLGGPWTTAHIARLSRELAAVAGAPTTQFDLSRMTGMDTAGAWVISKAERTLKDAGAAVSVTGASEGIASLLETVAEHHVVCPPPPKSENPLTAVLLRLGKASFEVGAEARDLVSFLGLTVVVLLRSILHPSRIRFTAMISHMEQSGLNALPIVGLISFLVGVVLAYQGADQLAKFGAEIFTVNLVAVGVLREMGILLTAIIVAGRSGSAYTAQIGTMKVNEEIDALRTIGLDPMDVLVMPRVIGLILVLPLLTFYADLMGLLGGAVMATVVLDISFVQFIRQLNDAATVSTFFVGLVKAPLFAFIIAMVGCYEGLQVSRSAESVGQQTTRAVVEAIFLVIVLDAMLSILFSVIGW